VTVVPVLWLPPGNQWDQSVLRDLLGGHLTPPGYEFQHYEVNATAPNVASAVVVVPGRYDDAEDQLIDVLSRLDHALVIVTGDEESSIEWEAVEVSVATECRWWFMTPDPAKDYPDGAHFLGSGYAPHLRDLLRPWDPNDEWCSVGSDVFYSGQVNHDGRRSCVDALDAYRDSLIERPDPVPVVEVLRSPGFTQGLSHDQYAAHLVTTHVAPAPGGQHTPDSFRLHEALEAGRVPIADGDPDYWAMVFGWPVPFPVLEDWTKVGKYIDDALDGWQAKANECSAWWQLHKRRMGTWLADDLTALGMPPTDEPAITVLIPTSPIEAHPSTEIIEETIASVRFWHPAAEILLMIDGVRPEQEEFRERYEEYVRRILWRCNFTWQRVTPVRFAEHTHQAAMTRRALELVRTPLVLFVEHDTPIVIDEPIPWGLIHESVLYGDLNVVRLFHEGVRQPDHRHLELDETPQDFAGHYGGLPIVRTMQWSQRPHVASVAFYRELIARHFSPDARTMIEDVLHGKAEEAWLRDGVMAWHQWRIGIYAPDTGNIKRSYHLDGRGAASKFEETFRC
jgi:hypothetical protein